MTCLIFTFYLPSPCGSSHSVKKPLTDKHKIRTRKFCSFSKHYTHLHLMNLNLHKHFHLFTIFTFYFVYVAWILLNVDLLNTRESSECVRNKNCCKVMVYDLTAMIINRICSCFVFLSHNINKSNKQNKQV